MRRRTCWEFFSERKVGQDCFSRPPTKHGALMAFGGGSARRSAAGPTLPQQPRDECGPAGLMRGTAAAAGVAVEVFVEEDEVTPVWIVRVA